jgi:hypothetical protein
MKIEQHRLRHCLLHAALDELVADWIMLRGSKKENFFTASITLHDFIKWSAQQATAPEPTINTAGEDISALDHTYNPKLHRKWQLELHPLKYQKLRPNSRPTPTSSSTNSRRASTTSKTPGRR